MKKIGIFLFAASLLGIACSGDDEGGGGAGGGAGASSSSSSGGSSSGSSDGSCTPAAPVTELASLPAECAMLTQSDDSLFTTDVQGGPSVAVGKSGVVLRVPKDGSAASPFYTPEAGRQVKSIFADGSELFVIEADPGAATERQGRLVKKSIASGAVTELLGTGFDKVLTAIVAVDANYVYVEQASTKSGMFGIYRVARAAGALETVVEVDSGAFLNTQLVGDDFVFSARVKDVHRVPKTNAGAPITAVGSKTCVSGFAATSDAIYCGQALELMKTDATLGNEQLVFRVDSVPALKATSASGVQPRLATSEAIYVRFNPGGTKVPILKVDRATNALKPVMCGLGFVDGTIADAQSFYALQVRNEKFESAAKIFKTAR
jgi:hypothetical protein